MLAQGRNQKVVLAMSGGVDSSVAAALLLEAGYQVVGCFMRLGSEEEPDCAPPAGRPGHQGCCSLNDAGDARLVAARLGIPFYVLNFRRDFDRIVDYFVAEYNAGRTPNPCIRCNQWLKFGKLRAYARSIEADLIASGHYARIAEVDGQPALLRGLDAGKDQSYVLFGAGPEELRRMILPVGHLHKAEVRRMARERGLPVFDKPDSQEICFVPDDDYAGLIRRTQPGSMQPGPVVDPAGAVLGRHAGHQQFTIGQRRGLGVAVGRPAYVLAKDPATNTVTIGPREGLLAGGLIAREVNWLIDPGHVPRTEPMPCQVKIRYNSPPAAASVLASGPDEFTVCFDQPLSAVTPGQAAVCYQGDRVIAGGWIRQALPRTG